MSRRCVELNGFPHAPSRPESFFSIQRLQPSRYKTRDMVVCERLALDPAVDLPRENGQYTTVSST